MSQPFDPRDFRNALGMFPTGVAVVTTRAPSGAFVGLTINSFSSLSLDPPLVLWSLNVRSPSAAAFERATHFAVNILCDQQVEVSKRFASPLAEQVRRDRRRCGPRRRAADPRLRGARRMPRARAARRRRSPALHRPRGALRVRSYAASAGLPRRALLPVGRISLVRSGHAARAHRRQMDRLLRRGLRPLRRRRRRRGRDPLGDPVARGERAARGARAAPARRARFPRRRADAAARRARPGALDRRERRAAAPRPGGAVRWRSRCWWSTSRSKACCTRPSCPTSSRAARACSWCRTSIPRSSSAACPIRRMEGVVRDAMRRLKAAKRMTVTSPAGTDLDDLARRRARRRRVGLHREARQRRALAGRPVPRVPGREVASTARW